jgi:uncharacterized protein (TIGR02271 family)
VQHDYSTRVHEGMEVLDMNGDKIGMCGETLGDYFNVDAGFLGMTEYYVPFNAITEITDDQIFLNVDKNQIGTMGWKDRPTATTTSNARMSDRTATDADTLRLREEELSTRKTSVETGAVHLGKDVVEEERELDVPVSREEVYVERRPVDRRAADRPIEAGQTETIRVPVREEHVEVEKQPVVYEEVAVGKRVTQDTERVSDTVRREELRVDTDGDVEIRNDPRA